MHALMSMLANRLWWVSSRLGRLPLSRSLSGTCVRHRLERNWLFASSYLHNNHGNQPADQKTYHSTGSLSESEWSSGHFTGANLLAALTFTLCASTNKEDLEKEFISAAKDNDTKTMKKLLVKGTDVNCRHSLGWNALHAAVANGHWDAVKLLVESGADVNAKDEFSSAQRVAAQRRTSSLLVELARDGEFCSYINHYASYSGFTPLHYAVLLNDTKFIKYLLDNGANPTLENNRGYTPGDYCTDEKIKLLLEEATIKLEENHMKEQLEERRRYPLEKRLRERIVGQEGPITATAAAIRRREMGWADDDHPMVLLFLGSSGIGKTELAKQIAHYIHKDNKKGFIRLDMSEFQEKHEVAKLIGSPPGYVGHDQGGQLTSQLSQCPNAVVLFDEVEKAHPDVLTVMLQLFDEGRLTDGQGKTIECKDALFVMTSNLASDEIAAHGLKLRKEAQQAAEQFRDSAEDPQKHIRISREFKELVVEPILKRHFKRDEFLGRINEMLYFLPFSRTELNLLVEKQLKTWEERAMKRHSIKLTWEREVLDILADGYNVKYGARSIKHEVERVVVTQLADAFEQGSLSPGDKVSLVVVEAGPGGKEGTPFVKLKITKTNNSSQLELDKLSFFSES